MPATRALTWFSLVIALVAPLQSNYRGLLQAATQHVRVLFVDDLHLDFPATGHVREVFKTISTILVNEEDLVAIVSRGPSSLAIDLRRDRQSVAAAREKISGAGLRPSEMVGPEDVPEVRYRAHVALDEPILSEGRHHHRGTPW